MRKLYLVAALTSALCMSACATVTRGTSEEMQFTSEPSGARASTSTGFSCTTPCTLIVSRKDEFVVKFEEEGYRPQEIPVKSQIAGAGAAGFAGNIVAGGIVGMVADAATGATLEHVPNPVHADLARIAEAPVRKAPPHLPAARAVLKPSDATD
jgi:hypothetical protein